MHNGSTRMRGHKGEEKTFEEKIAENFLSYLKNINLEKLEYIGGLISIIKTVQYQHIDKHIDQ